MRGDEVVAGKGGPPITPATRYDGCGESVTPLNGITAILVGLLIGLLLAPVTAFLGAWLAF